MRRSCHVSGVGSQSEPHAKNRQEFTLYYVYVLRSVTADRLYIGSSADPEGRLAAHNAGRGGWTKKFRPWKIVLLEEHSDRKIAEKRERYLKSGWGRRWIDRRLKTEAWQSG